MIEDLEDLNVLHRNRLTHIDYKHYGLGSASCGPGPLPQYTLKLSDFEFIVRFRPI